jgi:hypothetical protein
MDGREGTDARKSANQPWRTTILSRRQGESGAWPCAISRADWLAPAARDFCVSVGYRVHPILIWRIAIAFWNSIQLTSQSEKSCQMAVPPNRALLVAEVPFSGRARVRVVVRKLPLFGEPGTRRRFSKQYYAARQKSLLRCGRHLERTLGVYRACVPRSGRPVR